MALQGYSFPALFKVKEASLMEQQNQEILHFFPEVPYHEGEIERQTLEIRLRSYKRRLKRTLSLGSCSDTT